MIGAPEGLAPRRHLLGPFPSRILLWRTLAATVIF
jgi:hypothetical protein